MNKQSLLFLILLSGFIFSNYGWQVEPYIVDRDYGQVIALHNLTHSDHLNLLALEEDYLHDHYDTNVDAEVSGSVAAYRTFVVRDQEMVVGYGSCGYLVEDDRSAAFIMRLAVLPDYRHLGIAMALVQAMCDVFESENQPYVLVIILPKNSAAQALFQQLGFFVHDQRPDAVLMARVFEV